MNEISKIWEKINEIDERVKKLENTNQEIEFPSANKLQSLGIKLQGKIEKIGPQGLIIIALRYKPKHSKSDLLNILLNLGVKKTIHGWFKGSNFKWRLLDSGIIMKDGINSNNEDLFSLTITKGIPKADELIKKYSLK